MEDVVVLVLKTMMVRVIVLQVRKTVMLLIDVQLILIVVMMANVADRVPVMKMVDHVKNEYRLETILCKRTF
jgi:hypothetical protein